MCLDCLNRKEIFNSMIQRYHQFEFLESSMISNCMTRDLKTSQSTTLLFQICQIMKNNNIDSVIVVNESKFYWYNHRKRCSI